MAKQANNMGKWAKIKSKRAKRQAKARNRAKRARKSKKGQAKEQKGQFSTGGAKCLDWVGQLGGWVGRGPPTYNLIISTVR